MIEITASTKVSGKRRQASVEAARRKVRDGEDYLIRRHGAYFRPSAHGYTTELGAAGIFAAPVARSYLTVEGLSVVPLRSMRPFINAQIVEAQKAIAAMQHMALAAGEKSPPEPATTPHPAAPART